MASLAVARLGAAWGVRRASVGVRAMTTAGGGHVAEGDLGKAWKDRESAFENQYFNQADEKMLADLAAKMRKQTAPSPEQLVENKNRLIGILNKHGVPVAGPLVDDILAFKYGKE